jgi:hypothetical protein
MPTSTAMRQSADLAPVREQLLGRRWLGRRLRISNERAAAATARRVQKAAWASASERLAKRRARDPEPRAQLALGRQARARREQPELDRRAEPLDGLLERCLRADWSEYHRPSLEGRLDLNRLWRHTHSRSKPR